MRNAECGMRNAESEALSGAIGCAAGGTVAGLVGLGWVIRFLLLWFSALGGAGRAGSLDQPEPLEFAPQDVSRLVAGTLQSCERQLDECLTFYRAERYDYT